MCSETIQQGACRVCFSVVAPFPACSKTCFVASKVFQYRGCMVESSLKDLTVFEGWRYHTIITLQQQYIIELARSCLEIIPIAGSLISQYDNYLKEQYDEARDCRMTGEELDFSRLVVGEGLMFVLYIEQKIMDRIEAEATLPAQPQPPPTEGLSQAQEDA